MIKFKGNLSDIDTENLNKNRKSFKRMDSTLPATPRENMSYRKISDSSIIKCDTE